MSLAFHCKCGATWKGKRWHCQFCHRTYTDLGAFIAHEHEPEDDARWAKDKHGEWGTPPPVIEQGALL